MTFDALIVGGGLAGLGCALQLQQRGIRFLLLEASDGIGGRIRTDHVDGFGLDRNARFAGSRAYTSAAIIETMRQFRAPWCGGAGRPRPCWKTSQKCTGVSCNVNGLELPVELKQESVGDPEMLL